jgi:hypothetical protein
MGVARTVRRGYGVVHGHPIIKETMDFASIRSESARPSQTRYYRPPFDAFDGGCSWSFYGLALHDDSRKQRGRSMRMSGQVTLTPVRTPVRSLGEAS